MKNQIFFWLVAIVGILGAYVGDVTVDRYEIIVRATLGLTVLYLLYREYFLPKGGAVLIGDFVPLDEVPGGAIVFFVTMVATNAKMTDYFDKRNETIFQGLGLSGP